MQAYPMQSKIKLLATLDEEKRVNLMNTFLEEGSSGKEMIMMELDSIKSDDLELKRIEKDSANIWSEFITFGRERLSNNEGLRESAQEILEEWLVSMQDNKANVQEVKSA